LPEKGMSGESSGDLCCLRHAPSGRWLLLATQFRSRVRAHASSPSTLWGSRSTTWGKQSLVPISPLPPARHSLFERVVAQHATGAFRFLNSLPPLGTPSQNRSRTTRSGGNRTDTVAISPGFANNHESRAVARCAAACPPRPFLPCSRPLLRGSTSRRLRAGRGGSTIGAT